MNDYVARFRNALMQKEATAVQPPPYQYQQQPQQPVQQQPAQQQGDSMSWMQRYAPTAVGALGGLALGGLFGGRRGGFMSYALPALIGGGLGYLYQNLKGNNLSEKWNTLTGYWNAFTQNGFGGLASQWANNNPEQASAMASQWARDNPDQVRRLASEYMRNNPEFLSKHMAGMKDVVKQQVSNMIRQYKDEHFIKGKFINENEILQKIDDNWGGVVQGTSNYIQNALSNPTTPTQQPQQPQPAAQPAQPVQPQQPAAQQAPQYRQQ